jgi:hypothetical protein
VGARERHAAVLDGEGLGVADVRRPGGGVAHVADAHVARQRRESVLRKHVLHEAHRAVHVVPRVGALDRRDAGRLLPAVLQRVQPEVGEARGVGVAVHRKHPALVAEVVVGRVFGGIERRQRAPGQHRRLLCDGATVSPAGYHAAAVGAENAAEVLRGRLAAGPGALSSAAL